MRNTYVSFFENFKTNYSDKKITIWNWLMGDLGLANQIEAIRNSISKDDIRQAKSNLPAVTMSGIFGERKAKKIIEHSGFICIDIDGKDNPHINNFELLKQKLSFSKFIQYAGLSVSGNGLFCLIKISNSENHKEHFNSLLNYFLEMGIVIDKGCSDITRLRIYSIDNQPYLNEDAEVYSDTKAVINPAQNASNNSYNNIKRDFKPNIEQGRNVSITKLPREMMVTKILEQIEVKQIDITQEYNDWFVSIRPTTSRKYIN